MRALTLTIAAMALTCRCAAAAAPPPAAAGLWTRADLETLSLALERTGSPYTQLLKGKTYGVLVLRRSISGDPELHLKLNDFFVILGGEGEIKVGGRVIGERTVAPDERRGEKLIGGVPHRVRSGDVLFVPAGHWLQVLVTKGEVLQAVIIKTQ